MYNIRLVKSSQYENEGIMLFQKLVGYQWNPCFRKKGTKATARPTYSRTKGGNRTKTGIHTRTIGCGQRSHWTSDGLKPGSITGWNVTIWSKSPG